MKDLREQFETEGEARVAARLAEFQQLDFIAANELPAAQIDDIVVAGKEVQLAIFKQTGVIGMQDAVLITVQLARAGLGGLVNYQHERGLVFSPSGEVREATGAELAATGG